MPGGRGVEVDRPGGAGIPVASYKEDQGNTGGGPVRGSFAMESTSVSLAAQEGEGFGSSPTDDQKFLWASAMSRGDWATAEPGPSLYTGRAVGCGRGGCPPGGEEQGLSLFDPYYGWPCQGGAVVDAGRGRCASEGVGYVYLREPFVSEGGGWRMRGRCRVRAICVQQLRCPVCDAF